MPRDSYVIRHLGPDRDYVVMVIAHSEAGLTQGEYAVRTLPAAAIGNGSNLVSMGFFVVQKLNLKDFCFVFVIFFSYMFFFLLLLLISKRCFG